MSEATTWSAESDPPTEAAELGDWPPAASTRGRWSALDPGSPAPVLVGVGLTLVGFALMAVAWAKVAGLTDVWRQFPYLLSAGLPGLGLVMVGLVLVNVSVRRQDAAERERQFAALTEAVRDLRRAVDE